jgi:hypothetical protein
MALRNQEEAKDSASRSKSQLHLYARIINAFRNGKKAERNGKPTTQQPPLYVDSSEDLACPFYLANQSHQKRKMQSQAVTLAHFLWYL